MTSMMKLEMRLILTLALRLLFSIRIPIPSPSNLSSMKSVLSWIPVHQHLAQINCTCCITTSNSLKIIRVLSPLSPLHITLMWFPKDTDTFMFRLRTNKDFLQSGPSIPRPFVLQCSTSEVSFMLLDLLGNKSHPKTFTSTTKLALSPMLRNISSRNRTISA